MKYTIQFIFIISVILFPHFAFAENTNTNTSNETASVIELDKKEFLSTVFNYEKDMTKWTYEGSKPCLVVFYGDFCPPCRKLYPVLQNLAKEYQDEIAIYRVNVEKEKEIAAIFNIQSIPLILFVPIGETPQKVMGALPQKNLQEIIDTLLLGKKSVQ